MAAMRPESRSAYDDVEVTLRQGDDADAPGEPDPRVDDAPGRFGRRWDIRVVLAMAAVAAALVYSGLQARDSARDAQASRRALAATQRSSEFAAVLSLHREIFDASQRTSFAYRAMRGRARSADGESRLIEAVMPLEGIAYLLSHRMTPIPRAADVWKRYLICAFYTARAGVGPTIDLYVPELASFARARRPSIGRNRCNAIVLSR
jgi:hypothetical protein